MELGVPWNVVNNNLPFGKHNDYKVRSEINLSQNCKNNDIFDFHKKKAIQC